MRESIHQGEPVQFFIEREVRISAMARARELVEANETAGELKLEDGGKMVLHLDQSAEELTRIIDTIEAGGKTFYLGTKQ